MANGMGDRDRRCVRVTDWRRLLGLWTGLWTTLSTESGFCVHRTPQLVTSARRPSRMIAIAASRHERFVHQVEQVSTQNDMIFLDCVVVALIHCIGHRLTTVIAYVRSPIDVKDAWRKCL